jgi:hypothetical protein
MLGAAQSPGKVTRKAKWIAAKFPYDAPLEQIEARPRERLRRSTVAAVIQALAERLVAEQAVMGADAEVTIAKSLTLDDYVSAEFFTKASPATPGLYR